MQTSPFGFGLKAARADGSAARARSGQSSVTARHGRVPDPLSSRLVRLPPGALNLRAAPAHFFLSARIHFFIASVPQKAPDTPGEPRLMRLRRHSPDVAPPEGGPLTMTGR